MPLKKISGKECVKNQQTILSRFLSMLGNRNNYYKICDFRHVKILCNKFGFKIKRQRGSHIILSKETPEGKIGTVVPNHSELKIGTLKGVLELAKVSEEDFEKYQ